MAQEIELNIVPFLGTSPRCANWFYVRNSGKGSWKFYWRVSRVRCAKLIEFLETIYAHPSAGGCEATIEEGEEDS